MAAIPADAVLARLRERIDSCDEQIVRILARRIDLCREIAELKSVHRLPVMQPDRVAQVRDRYRWLAGETGIDADFAVAIYNAVLAECCRVEQAMVGAALPRPSVDRVIPTAGR
jgi:chorismate mutase-like protein